MVFGVILEYMHVFSNNYELHSHVCINHCNKISFILKKYSVIVTSQIFIQEILIYPHFRDCDIFVCFSKYFGKYSLRVYPLKQ
jgi:hypothetical protein